MKKLVLVMGLPGSGKSFFAERLAQELGAIYLSSDRERNRMGQRGRYSSEDKLKVYLNLAQSTKDALNKGNSIVVDATFHLQQMRDLFSRLAYEEGASVFYFHITAEENLIRERLCQPRSESQADFFVYQLIKKDFEPFAMDVTVLESKKDNIAFLMELAKNQINYEKK